MYFIDYVKTINIYSNKNSALLITYREMQTYNKTIIMKYWMSSKRTEIQQTQNKIEYIFYFLYWIFVPLDWIQMALLITLSIKECCSLNVHCLPKTQVCKHFVPDDSWPWSRSWLKEVRGKPCGFSTQIHFLSMFCFLTVDAGWPIDSLWPPCLPHRSELYFLKL